MMFLLSTRARPTRLGEGGWGSLDIRNNNSFKQRRDPERGRS
jgi:hypothetical protein